MINGNSAGAMRTLYNETSLLALIHRQLPPEKQARLKELGDKLEAETISEPERGELLGLVEEVETSDGERAEALLALAQQRGVTVRQLMRDLNLEPDFG